MTKEYEEGCNVPHAKGCVWADEAAEKAVRKTFRYLGVNLDNTVEVKEFQEDLRFGGKMRKIADKSIIAFVIVLATALGWAFFDGIIARIADLASKAKGGP